MNMGVLDFMFIYTAIFACFFITNEHIDERHEATITAIQDSGCAKPTKLELTPAVYNTWPNHKGVM
tara:strand:- start:5593 stop:5790 length:198 start_codon:yes stop_codon:yes gene_type:complete